MDQLNFSKELGFDQVPDKNFVPDLEHGCIVEFKSAQNQEGDNLKIRYKIYPGGRKTGKDYGNFEVSFDDLKNPDKEIGRILFTIKNGAISIIRKQIVEPQEYENKGLMTVGSSLLASYAPSELHVNRIEGSIQPDNISSIRSRLSIRNVKTNQHLETYVTKDSDPIVITYLSDTGPNILQRFNKRRVDR